MLVFALVGGFLLLFGLTVLYFSKSKKKMHAIEAVVPDSNGHLLHIFGYSIYMPDDAPGFDIYRHYVFDTSTNRFTAGDSQEGKGFDIESPFVERSMQTVSRKLGKSLRLAPDKEIRSAMKVVRRDYNTSDTEVVEKIPNDAFVVTKLRENEMGFSKVSLEIYRGGINICRHVFKAIAEHDFRICKSPVSNQVILIYSKGSTNYGIALAVIDLSTGEFLFDEYITEQRKSK